MKPLTHSGVSLEAENDAVGRISDLAADLSLRVAESRDDVVEAWRLVYRSYCRIGIIDPNPAEVHTTPLAISPQTSVVIGTAGGEAAATLSIMHDSPAGLPLDTVYSQELNAMRRRGERLLEVGLFADRRARMTRSVAAIFGMMRFVFYNAQFNNCTILAGVHPHHAGFYMKSFGFELAGEPSTHPAVKDHPVVLLRGDWQKQLKADPLPRGLVDFVKRPLSASAFDNRFQLTPQSIAGTPIEAYLAMKAQQATMPVLRAAG